MTTIKNKILIYNIIIIIIIINYEIFDNQPNNIINIVFLLFYFVCLFCIIYNYNNNTYMK